MCHALRKTEGDSHREVFNGNANILDMLALNVQKKFCTFIFGILK